MKYIALIGVAFGFFSPSVFAVSEADQRLLSAQIQYQNALKLQDHSAGRFRKAQQELESAKARFTDAQNILQKAETELNEASTVKNQTERVLAEASRNLDAAWGK